MIFITQVHKYTQSKIKISTETKTVEANCLEDFYRKVVIDAGFVTHDLHFLTRADDRTHLYRIKISKRYKSEKELVNEQQRSSEKAIPNFNTFE